MVGVRTVLGSDHGEVSPVDAEDRVLGSGAALIVPGVHRVRFSSAVAQEMVVGNGVVNPAVAVESPGASAPLFRGHVGVSAAVGPVPTVVSARATEPASDLVVLWPRDALWIGHRWRVRDVDDSETCIPVRDVKQGLARDGVNVEHVVVVKQRAAARGLGFGGIAAPSNDFAAGVLVLVVDVRAPRFEPKWNIEHLRALVEGA